MTATAPTSVPEEARIGAVGRLACLAGFILSVPRWTFFSCWVLALMAIGFSAASPKKIRMGSALGIVAGFWLLYVLAKAGLAAVFS